MRVQTLIPIAAAPASPPCPARLAALLRIAHVSIFGLSPGTGAGTADISKLLETQMKVVDTVSVCLWASLNYFAVIVKVAVLGLGV